MNKSQEEPLIENVSLGLRFTDDETEKIKTKKKISSKKNKEYYADPEKKLKLNVIGSKGKILYEKMNQYINKFKNDLKEDKNAENNKNSFLINDPINKKNSYSNQNINSKIKNSNSGRNSMILNKIIIL